MKKRNRKIARVDPTDYLGYHGKTISITYWDGRVETHSIVSILFGQYLHDADFSASLNDEQYWALHNYFTGKGSFLNAKIWLTDKKK